MGCSGSKDTEKPASLPADGAGTAAATTAAPPSGKTAEDTMAIPPTLEQRASSEISRTALVMERKEPVDEVYLISDQDFNKIGSGSFGKVVRAEHRQTQVIRAVKCIAKDDKVEVARVRNEVKIGKMMDHPNIVRMCETFEDKNCIYIVMELCNGGAVGALIKQEKVVKEEQSLTIAYQLLYAIHYMHISRLCHRDIKPDNLLLLEKDSVSIVKVADFGLSCQIPEGEMTTIAGTPAYAAPELLKGRYDEGCDLWSAGVTCFEMLCGEKPFEGKNDKDVTDKVKRGNFAFKAAAWQTVADSSKDLVRSLLAFNAKQRLKAKDAIKHEAAQRGAPTVTERSLVTRLTVALPNFCKQLGLKRVALQIVAAQVSEVHVSAARRLFMVLDRDGDGCISSEELLQGLESHGEGKQQSQAFSNAVQELCPICYTEFLGIMLDQDVYGQGGILATTFRFMDQDGDGFISAGDIQKMDLLTRSRGSDLVAEVKTKNKAGVSLGEFEELMRKGAGDHI